MRLIGLINPRRHLFGRLFLWFWVTLILTTVIAVWISRLFIEETFIDKPPSMELTRLERLAHRLPEVIESGPPIEVVLRGASRRLQAQLLLVDPNSEQIIRSDGPPLRPFERADILRIAQQSSPLLVRRGGRDVIGPVKMQIAETEYALFQMRPNNQGPQPFKRLGWIIPAALVVSALLCFWFARTIVRPVEQLQLASQRLSRGEWSTRLELSRFGKDELGLLASDFNFMATQLEKLWLEQKRLLGDISHELRSPLARLQMAVGLGQQQHLDSKVLERIEREAQRLEDMIAQLLALSRAETSPGQWQTITLNDLFVDVFSDAQFEAQHQGKRVLISALPEQSVSVSPALMVSAVENVLRNAIKYAVEQVAIEVVCNDDSWTVRIADDGEGLPAEECAAIFAPFYRPNVARDRDSGGVGLGLSIAKAAVELHHGAIKAEPAPERGLVVSITIPMSEPQHELETESRR